MSMKPTKADILKIKNASAARKEKASRKLDELSRPAREAAELTRAAKAMRADIDDAMKRSAKLNADAAKMRKRAEAFSETLKTPAKKKKK